MASLLDVLIFDAVYGSWILSLPLFTLDNIYQSISHSSVLMFADDIALYILYKEIVSPDMLQADLKSLIGLVSRE